MYVSGRSIDPKKNSISFVVGSKFGLRSHRWIISIKGRDVYVSIEGQSSKWHASLHSSGRWHIKETSGDVNNGKTFLKSHKKSVLLNAYPVGLCICIPDASLWRSVNPHKSVDPEFWLERPVYGGMIQVSVITWDFQKIKENWPGALEGAQLFAVRRVDISTVIGVIGHALIAKDPRVIEIRKRFRLPRAHQLSEDKRPGNLMASIAPWGGLFLLEAGPL